MRAASVYASHGADVLKNAEVVTLRKVRRRTTFYWREDRIRARRGAHVQEAVKPEEAVARIVAAKYAFHRLREGHYRLDE